MNQQKIVAFNNLLLDFSIFLKKTFTNEQFLGDYHLQLQSLININPLLIYQSFKDFVVPFSDKINACDEKFILHELTKSKNELGEYFLIFDKIWTQPQNTIDTKAKIFQYLKKLIRLCL